MLGWFFSHPWPLRLCWAWCRVQGWSKGDVLGKGWPGWEAGMGTPGNWAWLSAPDLDSWARGGGGKHLQVHKSVSGALPSAADDNCHSHPHALFFEPLTQPASVRKAELAIFCTKKKSQAIHLLNSFLTLKLLLFALNPLLSPYSFHFLLF